MKAHYLIGMIAITLLLTLSGCNTGEIIEEDVSGAATAEGVGGGEDASADIAEEVDVRALIKELSEEAGLPTEEEMTEETIENSTEEETSPEGKEIVIENFEGYPEDLDIKVGTTVKFINEQANFKHVIGIREWQDTRYSSKMIDGWNEIIPGESYEYIFEKAGKFQWLSKSNFPDTKGEITVT